MSLPGFGWLVLGTDLKRSEMISTAPPDLVCVTTPGGPGRKNTRSSTRGAVAAQMSFPSQFSESAAIPDV
jgi:hypothetical protein